MTGNVLIDLAISIVGVAILVGLSRLIFGGGALAFDEATAADRLAFDEPDFEPVAWIVDRDEKAALAKNLQGELALVMAHGDGLVTRRLAGASKSLEYEGGRMRIARTDLTARDVSFALPDSEALVWMGAAEGDATNRRN